MNDAGTMNESGKMHARMMGKKSAARTVNGVRAQHAREKAKMREKGDRRPTVSVVITIYNEAHCVEQAIESMLAQTYRDFELVLVDNGSRDGTPSVLRRYRADARVRILRLPKNTGPGGGRNAGAKIARGDILVFVDADMRFDPKYLATLTKPIRDGACIGTSHTKELVANPENVWARSWCINRIPDNPVAGGVFRAVLRKRFLAIGGFDTRKGYFDDDLSAELGIATLVPAVCYHNNPVSLSEVFHHSRWVGRSLAARRTIRVGVIAGSAWMAASALLLPFTPSLFISSAGIAVIGWLLFSLRRAIPRIAEEGRWEYLVTIPLLWGVRFAGYGAGVWERSLRGR